VRFVLAWVLAALSHPALGCTIPPEHWNDDPYSMVIQSRTIVLARVERVARRGDTTRAEFVTVETLRGEAARTFSLRGWHEDEPVDDFTGHRDPAFWVTNIEASSVAPGDCSAYGVFQTGQTYLIFLEGPNHPRSFENVRSPDDLWLQTVRAALARLDMILGRARSEREASSSPERTMPQADAPEVH
jgi:hypothetical protein